MKELYRKFQTVTLRHTELQADYGNNILYEGIEVQNEVFRASEGFVPNASVMSKQADFCILYLFFVAFFHD